MDAKPYSSARRIEYLREVAPQLEGIFSELTAKSKADIMSAMPPVDGFRPGTAPLNICLKELRMHLAKGTSKAWRVVMHLWIEWVLSQRAEGESGLTLHQILQDFDNAADIDDSVSPKRVIHEANSELDIKCFEYLLEKNRNGLVSKELVERFYFIGHFLRSDKIELLISKMRTHKDLFGLLVVERTVDELTEKVDQIESISSKIEDLFLEYRKQQKSLKEEFSDVDKKTSVLEKQFNEQGKTLNALKLNLKQIADDTHSLPEKMFSTNSDFARLGETVAMLSTRLDKIEKSETLVADVKKIGKLIPINIVEGAKFENVDSLVQLRDRLFLCLGRSSDTKSKMIIASATCASAIAGENVIFPNIGFSRALSALMGVRHQALVTVGPNQYGTASLFKGANTAIQQLITEGIVPTSEWSLIVKDFDRTSSDLYLEHEIFSSTLDLDSPLGLRAFVPVRDHLKMPVGLRLLECGFDLRSFPGDWSVDHDESRNSFRLTEKFYEDLNDCLESTNGVEMDVFNSLVTELLPQTGGVDWSSIRNSFRKYMALSRDLASTDEAVRSFLCGKVVPILLSLNAQSENAKLTGVSIVLERILPDLELLVMKGRQVYGGF